jgi:UDP-glucose:(heptosyl)LPS alpha-1,3-glucosyltransferase
MKIALVVHDFDPRYGQGRYAWELARRMARQHEVRVFANTFINPGETGISFVKVPAWRANALTTVWSFLRNSEKLLGSQPCDIVHAQGLTCWQADVITAHICNAARWEHSPPRRLPSRLFHALVGPLEKRFYQQPRAGHLVAISRQVADEVKRHYNWQRPVTVIHHGTDTEKFRPPLNAAERLAARQRYHLGESEWVWLFVGEAAKGLREAIEQLPSFPAAKLLVVSHSDLAGFRRLADALDVSGQVHLHGPEEDIASAYRAADVFVYPSAYDAFGLVVAEAMASGLPVILGGNVGAAEWIKHRQNGLICDPASSHSLREELAWLQANSASAAELGVAARITVEQHSWDACAAATLAVYEQVLQERRTP